MSNASTEPGIVSVSRRTDVPAFYGEWFMRRLAAGFAVWENPYGRQLYRVSLRREHVRAFAFWSKNIRPFLPRLRDIKDAGFPCVFNYTITGLPRPYEPGVVEADDAVDSLKALSVMFSPDHVNWRYDPILLSEATDSGYHIARFSALAAQLEGSVRRCIISFVCMYGKVKRSFARFGVEQAVHFRDPSADERRELAGSLAAIAARRGMSLHVCCGDAIVGGPVQKASCVDGDVVSRLYFGGEWKGVRRPTREECGCTESTDIGAYDSCPHGCIYCYANVNKEKADRAFRSHDVQAETLGSKAAAD